MRHKNIALDTLIEILNSSELLLNGELLDLWNSIKIEPIEWVQQSDSHTRLFWVVALLDKKVIWFNHTDNSFNISSFSDYSIIGDHCYCGTKLDDICVALLK